MGRPSPRTQGIVIDPLTGQVDTFQKFGTQQLNYLDPVKPASGVTQINTGQQFKGFTTSGYTGTKTTAFSQQFQAGITGSQQSVPRDVAIQMQKEKLEEMGLPFIPEFPNLGDLFGGGAIDKHGCECENCKNGTGQCSERRAECNAWDVGCEMGGGLTDIIGGGLTNVITTPLASWWDKYGNWVYVILGVIGLGILLWLIRPLFGFLQNVSGIAKTVKK